MTNTSVETTPTENIKIEAEKKPDEQVKKSIERVLMTQKELDNIKENLNKMIDAMAHNPSYLSRASAFWGERPLWQKIVAGIVLIVPTFIIAVVAQIAILLTISILTLIIFTAASILLDNHHNLNLNRTEHLKAGISGIADTLGAVILSLDKLRDLVAEEVKRFQTENTNLKDHVNDLEDQVTLFTQRNKETKDIVDKLGKTKDDLEKQNTTLADSLKEQTELLHSYQEQLKQALANYEDAKTALTNKVADLSKINKELKEETQQWKNISQGLKGVYDTFLENMGLDQTQKTAFYEKLNKFLTDEKTSFHQIAERICDAEKRLKHTQEQLDQANQRHDRLLDRNEDQIRRFEQAQNTITTPAAILKSVGTFSVSGMKHLPEQEERLESMEYH